jgi:osmoprotectant transport system substrate-binding protein
LARAQIIILVVAFLTGCSGNPRIVVGSKNFTEQMLLGEMIAQQIERRLGFAVERKLNLGGTLLAHEALRTGAIDLYPEYTGTALTAVLKKPLSDPDSVFSQVQAEYRARWGLTWLPPLGFNNTFAMVIRKGEGNVSSISQAAQAKKPWRLGVGFEFLQRPDGLEGLLKIYGLPIEGAPVTMDLGLLYTALQSGKVDMVAANSTDGLLSVLPVTALVDDKRYFPPYECSVVVREDALTRHEGLREALEQLSGHLTAETMRKLNHAVDGERRSVREVAAEAISRISR